MKSHPLSMTEVKRLLTLEWEYERNRNLEYDLAGDAAKKAFEEDYEKYSTVKWTRRKSGIEAHWLNNNEALCIRFTEMLFYWLKPKRGKNG